MPCRGGLFTEGPWEWAEARQRAPRGSWAFRGPGQGPRHLEVRGGPQRWLCLCALGPTMEAVRGQQGASATAQREAGQTPAPALVWMAAVPPTLPSPPVPKFLSLLSPQACFVSLRLSLSQHFSHGLARFTPSVFLLVEVPPCPECGRAHSFPGPSRRTMRKIYTAAVRYTQVLGGPWGQLEPPSSKLGPSGGWWGWWGKRVTGTQPGRPSGREMAVLASGGLGTPHSPSPPPHLPSAKEPGIRSFQSGSQQTCLVHG